MDILQLIEGHRTVRKYQDKPIPRELLDKIIEAGIWGPSIIGMQPWKFIIVEDKCIQREIYNILLKKSKSLGIVGRFVLKSSLEAINTAKVIIVTYNSGIFTKFIKKFRKTHLKAAKISDIAAISAAIQNMVITAESMGIGSCWLDSPIMCERKINKLFNTNDQLIALLTFGYPAEEGRRSKRKPLSDTVIYLK